MAWHLQISVPGLPATLSAGGTETEAEAQACRVELEAAGLSVEVVEVEGPATSVHTGGELRPIPGET